MESAGETGNEPRIIVLTAPSGSGKTSIARRLLAAIPALSFSVSATTRPPRVGEEDGRDYHFLSAEAFRKEVADGGLIEFEEVYPGRFYGTLKRTVDAATRASPTLLDIDVVGAARVKELFGPEALTVFVMPPSIAVLEERLRNRGSETEDTLRTRLDRAAMELSAADQFDTVIVNDHLETAAEETIARVKSFLASTP
ncbi:MAG: guanylate kinase [Rhodothermales bacterium]|nr:guanylate kinase [Rhodothermales bacterium]